MSKLISIALWAVLMTALTAVYSPRAIAFDSFETFLTRPGQLTDNLLEVIHSARGNDAQSQYILARLLYIGYGVKRDQVNAEKWLDKAVESKFADAVYMKGLIILQNEESYNAYSRLGESLMLTLVEQKHPEAIKFLAHAYAIGDVLPLNPKKANQLYQLLFTMTPRVAVNQAIESFATAIGLYRLDNDDLMEQYRQSLFDWHKKAIAFEEYKRCSSVAYAYQDTETQTAWRYFCKNAGQRDQQLSLQLIDSQDLLNTEQLKVVQEKTQWLKQNILNNYQDIPPK
jgi:hypothetical protein